MTASKSPTGPRSQINLGDLSQYEKLLSSTFEPVSPRQDFVQGLRSRLTLPVQKEPNPIGFLEYILLILAGIVSASILIIAAIRMVLALVESIRVLRNVRSPSKSPRPPSFSLSR